MYSSSCLDNGTHSFKIEPFNSVWDKRNWLYVLVHFILNSFKLAWAVWAVRSQEHLDMENFCVLTFWPRTWPELSFPWECVMCPSWKKYTDLSMPETCLIHKVHIKNSTKFLIFFNVGSGEAQAFFLICYNSFPSNNALAKWQVGDPVSG